MRNWIKGRKWSDVLATMPDRVTRMLEYAKQDAIRCWQIWTKYLPYFPERERRLSKLTMDCTAYGVAVDVDRLRSYLTIVEEEKWTLEKTLPWIAEGEAAGSSSALCDQCRRVGIPAPPLKKDDAAAFDVWQATYQDEYPWVGAVGRWRKTGKMLSFLKTVESRLREEDGCMSVETPLKYFGAHTGRWSGDSLNFQNMRRDPLRIGDHEIDVRGLFIPRPGHTLFVADYAQIEPRVLAWLAGDQRMLELVRGGFAVYEAHARATMGWTGGVLKDENKDLYKLAKARVLGLGYGCGWEKFIVVAFAMAGLKLTEKESRNTVQTFRESNPKITALWRKLDTTSRESEANREHLDLCLPSGRELHYLNVQSRKIIRNKLYEDEGESDIPEHERRYKLSYTATYGGRKNRAVYGALLTENVTQATARDVFVEALLELNDTGLRTPFHTHDEFVIEMPEDTEDEDVLRILKKCPDWLAGCPIEVEAARMSRYTK
jgi:DNA polymerase